MRLLLVLAIVLFLAAPASAAAVRAGVSLDVDVTVGAVDEHVDVSITERFFANPASACITVNPYAKYAHVDYRCVSGLVGSGGDGKTSTLG